MFRRLLRFLSARPGGAAGDLVVGDVVVGDVVVGLGAGELAGCVVAAGCAAAAAAGSSSESRALRRRMNALRSPCSVGGKMFSRTTSSHRR